MIVNWFGFWGKKIYTLQDILNLKKEDELLIIGEDEIILKGENYEKVFVKYNPYGKRECYTYIEKQNEE